MISVSNCRKYLAYIWYGMTLPTMFVLVYMTMYNVSIGDRATELWGWFTPLVAPMLSLITSVMFTNNAPPPAGPRHVQKHRFGIAAIASGLYLVLIGGCVLSLPAVHYSFDKLHSYSLFLSLFQAVVLVMIGLFFGARDAGAGAPLGAAPSGPPASRGQIAMS